MERRDLNCTIESIDLLNSSIEETANPKMDEEAKISTATSKAPQLCSLQAYSSVTLSQSNTTASCMVSTHSEIHSSRSSSAFTLPFGSSIPVRNQESSKSPKSSQLSNQWHTPKNVNRYKKDYQCLKMCLDKLFHEKISLSILIS